MWKCNKFSTTQVLREIILFFFRETKMTVDLQWFMPIALVITSSLIIIIIICNVCFCYKVIQNEGQATTANDNVISMKTKKYLIVWEQFKVKRILALQAWGWKYTVSKS